MDNVVLQGICDRVPLVKVVVPKNQSHSFITQGSPDTMVRFGSSEIMFFLRLLYPDMADGVFCLHWLR